MFPPLNITQIEALEEKKDAQVQKMYWCPPAYILIQCSHNALYIVLAQELTNWCLSLEQEETVDKLASLASITQAIQTLCRHRGDADAVLCLTWTVHQFGQWLLLFLLCLQWLLKFFTVNIKGCSSLVYISILFCWLCKITYHSPVFNGTLTHLLALNN